MVDHSLKTHCSHGVPMDPKFKCPRCEVVWHQEAVNRYRYLLKKHKKLLADAKSRAGTPDTEREDGQ